MGQRKVMPFDEIRRAADCAQAKDFIEKMDEQYATVIGERGVGLSGGQKQRISIARAIAKHAPILILDDSTSALDMETEHEIQKTLNELKDTTKMIIAHRISAVCHADEIIYLKDGEIAERGTHQELLAKRGLYYETYMAQYGTFLGGGDVMAVNSYREDEFMENTDKKKIMRRLFSYLLAYKGTIIAVLVCMGITVAISLVNPLLIEEAIDHYIAQSDLHGLIGLGILHSC